ncbi:MarR family winged helix-turn-helix transcriptional regulator [Xylanimonas sp. McL0601]|uniref:MarR family winged helix-turn-helix transcriptional regulator n=1 Tax=Xylanimonas sp. McL0601 TaxID=3414739 RepID=UPI003CEFF472
MARDEDAQDLAEALRTAVSRFVRAVRQRADSLPPSRAETLRHLQTAGPQTMAELAVARDVSHQSVSRMVGELERLGLVARRPNPADARGFLIALTAEGRLELGADQTARRSLIGAAILTALDDDERAMLATVPALLDRLVDALADGE